MRQPGLPDAWTGAGVLCDLVRGELYGTGFTPGEVHDVDVAFFDPADLSGAVTSRPPRGCSPGARGYRGRPVTSPARRWPGVRVIPPS